METGNPVRDGRILSNDDLGALTRKFRDIARRIEEGSLDLSETLKNLQNVAEGKTVPQKIHTGRARPQEFTRPLRKERRNSLGAISKRLPLMRQRLEFPQRDPEHIIVELWEAENIPSRGTNYGRTPIHAILDERERPDGEMPYMYRPERLNERDIKIVNSTIQWLGTGIGRCFLGKFLGVSQIII